MQILNMVLPVITLVLGSFLAYLFQKKNLERSKEWDKEKSAEQFIQEQKKMDKQFNFELEKIERHFAKEQLLNKMEIYNRILRAIEENEVVVWPSHQGEELEFEVLVYTEKIKPLLYESFHLLNIEIAKKVIIMDNMIGKWNYNEEADEGDAEIMAKSIEKIKRVIMDELEEFRQTYIKKISLD